MGPNGFTHCSALWCCQRFDGIDIDVDLVHGMNKLWIVIRGAAISGCAVCACPRPFEILLLFTLFGIGPSPNECVRTHFMRTLCHTAKEQYNDDAIQREKWWKMGSETRYSQLKISHNAEIFIFHPEVCVWHKYMDKYSEKEWKSHNEDDGDGDDGGSSKHRRTIKSIVQFRKFIIIIECAAQLQRKKNTILFLFIYFPSENFLCSTEFSLCSISTTYVGKHTLRALLFTSKLSLLPYRILKVANFSYSREKKTHKLKRRQRIFQLTVP